jgi:peptidoglycan/LPS O-acetylase OafA/YrhL
MTARTKILGKIAATLCVFFILKWLIGYVALSSFAKVSIDTEFDHDDVVDIYYSSGINDTGFRPEQTKRSARPYKKDLRSSPPIYLNNHVARKLRVDTGLEPGSVKLYRIVLTSYYGKEIVFEYDDIYRFFTPNDNIDSYTLGDDHVLVNAVSGDPFLAYQEDLVLPNFFLANILPMILAILFFIFTSTHTLRTFPAFADIDNKRPSSGVNYGSLDGIRGLAALLVLCEHTIASMNGSGTYGVWLFFCLSGFLLTMPFIRKPDRALSYGYMSHFITRRIKRIVPMYYVMITVTILFLGKFDVAIRHYLFLQADGHYWTVAQEMFFYMILPFIMLINVLLFRKKILPTILFLGLTAYLANRYITIEIVPLYGNNVALKPMIGIFLIGVCMAYIYHWLVTSFPQLTSNRSFRTVLSSAGIVLLILSLLTSVHAFESIKFFDAWRNPGWFGLSAGLIILLTILSGKTWLDKIMNFLPLRAVGLVGFSFYLVHPMMISVVRGMTSYFTSYVMQEWVLFIVAGLFSYGLSAFTYSYIERPFIKSSRTRGAIQQEEKQLESGPEVVN